MLEIYDNLMLNPGAEEAMAYFYLQKMHSEFF